MGLGNVLSQYWFMRGYSYFHNYDFQFMEPKKTAINSSLLIDKYDLSKEQIQDIESKLFTVDNARNTRGIEEMKESHLVMAKYFEDPRLITFHLPKDSHDTMERDIRELARMGKGYRRRLALLRVQLFLLFPCSL